MRWGFCDVHVALCEVRRLCVGLEGAIWGKKHRAVGCCRDVPPPRPAPPHPAPPHLRHCAVSLRLYLSPPAGLHGDG